MKNGGSYVSKTGPGCLTELIMTLVGIPVILGFVAAVVALIAANSSTDADWAYSMAYNGLSLFLMPRDAAIARLIILSVVAGAGLAIWLAIFVGIMRKTRRQAADERAQRSSNHQ